MFVENWLNERQEKGRQASLLPAARLYPMR